MRQHIDLNSDHGCCPSERGKKERKEKKEELPVVSSGSRRNDGLKFASGKITQFVA
uniref:Uncharacterized protein n=1 Tax=Arundo donax TaxID=35708 RepID=A0A0A8ZXT6_ARUDO